MQEVAPLNGIKLRNASLGDTFKRDLDADAKDEAADIIADFSRTLWAYPGLVRRE